MSYFREEKSMNRCVVSRGSHLMSLHVQWLDKKSFIIAGNFLFLVNYGRRWNLWKGFMKNKIIKWKNSTWAKVKWMPNWLRCQFLTMVRECGGSRLSKGGPEWVQRPTARMYEHYAPHSLSENFMHQCIWVSLEPYHINLRLHVAKESPPLSFVTTGDPKWMLNDLI